MRFITTAAIDVWRAVKATPKALIYLAIAAGIILLVSTPSLALAALFFWTLAIPFEDGVIAATLVIAAGLALWNWWASIEERTRQNRSS